MANLTEKQEELVQALMGRVLWWVEGEEVHARAGDLRHFCIERTGGMSARLVAEAVPILSRWFRRRLGELVASGRIEAWPAIRLVDGMPTHIDGVDGVPSAQIPRRSA